MASKKFRTLFLIRFFSYFGIILGTLAITFEFGPIALAEYQYRADQALGIRHTISQNVTTPGGNRVTQSLTATGSSSFEGASGLGDISITPVSTDFGIVIEKINANAQVIPNVDPANQAEYTAALAKGVAEAKGSTPPGEPGNLYIFSHSTDAPWDVIRYNAIFYLLRELNVGDRVIIFYQGRRYDYVVFDKTIVDPSNTDFLNYRYDKPVLTLQTCDPPGTLVHRLIVRARLEGS